MQQNHDSPTPEQLEALKQAAAFAYGRSLAMWNTTKQEKYYQQIERLEHDLRYFGCFNMGQNTLKEEYFKFQVDGAAHAIEELEKLGL